MKMMCTVMAGLFLAIPSFSEVLNSDLSVCVAGQVTAVETEPVAVSMNAAGMAVFSAGDLLGESGEPQIPWKMLRVVLPSDTDLETVSCRVAAEYKPLEGEWNVAPVPPVLTRDEAGNEIEIWPAGKTMVDGRDSAIYSTNALWPGEKVRLAGTGHLRSWCLAEITVPLVRYNPVTGELQQLIRAEIAVDCSVKKTGLKKRAVGGWTGQDRLEKLVVNFADSKEIKTKSAASKAPSGTSGYLIITTQNIRDNSTKLAAFATHKRSMGFVVTVIDEDDIWGTETPRAGDASATKLREWLQDNYISMDLKYALIIGDPQVDQGYVPMKKYSYSGQDIPTDYFYAELTCDWDKDGDGIIGEKGSSATSGAEIERHFELYVGRIPHYGVMANTDAILQKTIDYETSTDTAWRRNVLISVKPLDSMMHCYNWGEQVKNNLLEPKAISSDRVYRDGYSHKVTAYDYIPPPEFSTSIYPATAWNRGQYGLHVWSTHGSPTLAAAVITSGETTNLDDAHPSTVFQASCLNARPNVTGNLSYSLLKNGGIFTIGAARNSYYGTQTDFSNSPTGCGMAYRYAKGISEGKSCGEALWGLKETISSFWPHNWAMYNPYGDPSVVVMLPPPPFSMTPTDAFFTRMDYAVGSSASRTYTLRNNSGSVLNWTASKTGTWFDLSASSGTIPVGGSATVNITLNAETAHLSVATYEAAAIFTDTSNNIIAERSVVLVVKPNDSLRGHWKLDETSGTTAKDQSVFKNDGMLSGADFSYSSGSGKYRRSVYLDGVNDHIMLSGIRLNANTVTITAWISPNSSTKSWAGIVFDRSNSASGLSLDNGELRYHWNDESFSYEWNSGLNPAEGYWTFVALVIEPTRATIYMNSDFAPGFQSAVNVAPHDPVTFSTTYIGWDPGSYSRDFKGKIDDVRIYNYSMPLADLQNVYEGGGTESPTPFDGETDVKRSDIHWLPGVAATTHDVYIGTSQAAVAGASKSSPEYKGTTTSATFSSTIFDSTSYYWRIDTVTASTTLTGSVWTFTTGTVWKPGNIISINFEQNSNQNFSGNELIGPLALNSTHWNATAGASGSLVNLINGMGTTTGVNIAWDCSNLWHTDQGGSDDEHKLSLGYLDDGDSGSGNGVTVTISNIPYTAYKIYGLFSSDTSANSAIQSHDFKVNGTWVYGGATPSTTTVYGNIELNHSTHGEYWTEIARNTVVGNYWTMVSTGTTCSITGRIKQESTRGSLSGIIIEKLQDTDGDGTPDDTDSDDDNDGIPDNWENTHGLNSLLDDRTGDPDADAQNNWFEYITDTDPQNSQSMQTFLLEIDPQKQMVTRFSTSANRRYTVEYSTNLTNQFWMDLVVPFDGTGSEMTVPDTDVFSERFYRLLIEFP